MDEPKTAKSNAIQRVPTAKGSLWRHKKRGTVYEIIGPAIMQAEASPLNESACVIYRHIESETMWVRPTCEFFDGRFEKIDAALAEKETK